MNCEPCNEIVETNTVQPQPKSSSYSAYLSLPFHNLNLRFNPFGELPRDIRGHLAVADVSDHVQNLRDPRCAIQFIGEQGRGKTTHLLAIKSMLPRAAYVYIDEDEHAPIPTGNPLLIDEAQRLSWLERRVAFRKNVGLAIGTHNDLTKSLQRFGYHVTTVFVEQEATAEHLFECFNKRIAYARRSSGPIPYLTLRTAISLREEFGSNIRGMEARLYDLFQNLKSIGDV